MLSGKPDDPWRPLAGQPSRRRYPLRASSQIVESENIVAEHWLASQIAVTMPLAPQHVGYLLNPTRKS